MVTGTFYNARTGLLPFMCSTLCVIMLEKMETSRKCLLNLKKNSWSRSFWLVKQSRKSLLMDPSPASLSAHGWRPADNSFLISPYYNASYRALLVFKSIHAQNIGLSRKRASLLRDQTGKDRAESSLMSGRHCQHKSLALLSLIHCSAYQNPAASQTSMRILPYLFLSGL